jgi:alkanesulfonate monooxygenase SsuD/methylene tetrahydromethanopterin reductase-like flavin-dependent oxidoreductase (luciferase family)
MKLALHINNFSWPGFRFRATLAETARSADSCGFDRIGVADHLWQHPVMGGPEAEELECYSTLAFLAANTERTRLMAIVSGVHFRHPGVLAKTVSTLDVLSGGRATLGIGAGHYEEEAHGLGIPFTPLKERFEMLDDTVQICLRMWTGERGDERPFEGAHYRLERSLNLPQSIIRPHPPILMAGDGEKKTYAWSRATLTPVVCARVRRSRRSWTFCAGIARPRGAITTRSRRPVCSPSMSARTARRLVR